MDGIIKDRKLIIPNNKLIDMLFGKHDTMRVFDTQDPVPFMYAFSEEGFIIALDAIEDDLTRDYFCHRSQITKRDHGRLRLDKRTVADLALPDPCPVNLELSPFHMTIIPSTHYETFRSYQPKRESRRSNIMHVLTRKRPYTQSTVNNSES